MIFRIRLIFLLLFPSREKEDEESNDEWLPEQNLNKVNERLPDILTGSNLFLF